MHKIFPRGVLLLAISLTGSFAKADVKLPNIFTDSMVLQRNQANAIWGNATPGESIAVHIGDQQKSTKADSAGNWKVMLEPMQVGDPLELTVKGNNEIRIKDILVGEVWICSGQSNMQWSVNASNNVALEKASANYPNIRMINFPQVGSQEPIWSHDDRKWMVCNPQTPAISFTAGMLFFRILTS